MHLWGSIRQNLLPRSNRFRDEMGCKNESKNNREKTPFPLYFFSRSSVPADLKTALLQFLYSDERNDIQNKPHFVQMHSYFLNILFFI